MKSRQERRSAPARGSEHYNVASKSKFVHRPAVTQIQKQSAQAEATALDSGMGKLFSDWALLQTLGIWPSTDIRSTRRYMYAISPAINLSTELSSLKDSLAKEDKELLSTWLYVEIDSHRSLVLTDKIRTKNPIAKAWEEDKENPPSRVLVAHGCLVEDRKLKDSKCDVLFNEVGLGMMRAQEMRGTNNPELYQKFQFQYVTGARLEPRPNGGFFIHGGPFSENEWCGRSSKHRLSGMNVTLDRGTIE